MTKDLDALAVEIEEAVTAYDSGDQWATLTDQRTLSIDDMRALLAERKQMKAALEEIATNHANGATFSGTDCAEIAREALGDE